jgi:hypothetical protein
MQMQKLWNIELNGKTTMNGEQIRIWKEETVVYFKAAHNLSIYL